MAPRLRPILVARHIGGRPFDIMVRWTARAGALAPAQLAVFIAVATGVLAATSARCEPFEAAQLREVVLHPACHV